MNTIQVAKTVVETRSAHLVRERKGQQGEYDAKPIFTGNKRGWLMLDLTTASAITAVYDALSEENRAKYAAMPLLKAANVAFKLLAKHGRSASTARDV